MSTPQRLLDCMLYLFSLRLRYIWDQLCQYVYKMSKWNKRSMWACWREM